MVLNKSAIAMNSQCVSVDRISTQALEAPPVRRPHLRSENWSNDFAQFYKLDGDEAGRGQVASEHVAVDIIAARKTPWRRMVVKRSKWRAEWESVVAPVMLAGFVATTLGLLTMVIWLAR